MVWMLECVQGRYRAGHSDHGGDLGLRGMPGKSGSGGGKGPLDLCILKHSLHTHLLDDVLEKLAIDSRSKAEIRNMLASFKVYRQQFGFPHEDTI